MPISKEKKALYSKDWPQIRQRILERDEHCCKECGVPNYSIVWKASGKRLVLGPPFKSRKEAAEYLRQREGSLIMKCSSIVILTISHSCHDESCTDEAHLDALCQYHHNLRDQEHRKANANRTREQKREAQHEWESLLV